jgi:hypothetical protein
MKKLALAAVLLLVLVLAVAGTASAQVGPTANAGKVRAWSPQFFNGTEKYTPDQAAQIAKTFDTIVALPTAFNNDVATMKAANPNLTLFLYMKGVFTYNTTLPEATYAHDASGNRIEGLRYKGTYLLDPSSPRTLNYDVKFASRELADTNYDGVFLDTMGSAPLSPGWSSGMPINPATGQVWTSSDWQNATGNLAGQVASQLGHPTILNGLQNGNSYFDGAAPSSTLIQSGGVTGGMAEGWLRGATSAIDRYASEASWKKDVDALTQAGQNGKSFLAVTKTWTNATQQQKDDWYTFAVASYLLGNTGNGYLAYTYTPGDSTTTLPLTNLDLGAATGSYAKTNNVYQRTFTGGRVLVNPNPKSTFTVALGGTFHTLNGTAITSITLAPHTAAILTN